MSYSEPVARLMDVQLRGLNGNGSSAFPTKKYLNSNYQTVCADQIDFLFTSDNSNLEITILRPKKIYGLVIANQYEKIPAQKDMLLYVGDVIFNGTDIYSLFEYLIGGRVWLNPRAAVVIINERLAAPFSKTTHEATSRLKQEPEIRSNAFGLRG